MAHPAQRSEPKIAAKLLRQAAARGPDKSICPSEVARALAPDDDWRRLMGPVRSAAVRLAKSGPIEILRKGKAADSNALGGVIRLRDAAGGGG